MTTWMDAPIATLNMKLIGDVLVRLPMVALQLGHTNLEKLDAYLHPTSPEGEYVRDVVFALMERKGMTLEKFIEKWYGSEDAALEFSARLWAVPETEAA